jgi:hypothetical protein
VGRSSRIVRWSATLAQEGCSSPLMLDLLRNGRSSVPEASRCSCFNPANDKTLPAPPELSVGQRAAAPVAWRLVAASPRSESDGSRVPSRRLRYGARPTRMPLRSFPRASVTFSGYRRYLGRYWSDSGPLEASSSLRSSVVARSGSGDVDPGRRRLETVPRETPGVAQGASLDPESGDHVDFVRPRLTPALGA